MRFLADTGASKRVVEWLRGDGHDVIHLLEEGLERLPNGEIFAKATRENRIVLTFDLDFGEIVALSRPAPAPVIVFRLHNTRAAHVIERLASALKPSEAYLDTACVIVIEESRHRVRRFPSGVE